MAKIWFFKKGEQPIPAGSKPKAEKPLAWCIKHLGLLPNCWKTPLGSPPQFESDRPDLDPIRDPQYVVVEVGEEELTEFADKGWRSGFYYCYRPIQEVREKLQGAN